ncbi:uncharacterized protein F4812DRAFT_458209 [Daldinia caldariorum]|uniref:uncharacterized protein n=1 Tax=Daldinia caldariorum TaxID=326644 RepID=UPI0020087CD7|nr:uncharacterized protein F4812DRAFT_458209 [Daldinia caldariorum]KAI1468680.1 hypothetical protein F4812DRAFT_458209 [Daldinia caldariorum]
MTSESAERFYHLYHQWPRAILARMVTPYFDLDQHIAILTGPESIPDVTISMEERKWAVHSSVIASESNFFRAALRYPFVESQTGVIWLYELDPELVDFAIHYMYNTDFDNAARRVWNHPGSAVPPQTTADILVVADYLDMPGLMYRAYHTLVTGMARLAARKSQVGPAYAGESCPIDYLGAAGILEDSATMVGLDLGEHIRTLAAKLSKARSFAKARDAFKEVFPDEKAIFDAELAR